MTEVTEQKGRETRTSRRCEADPDLDAEGVQGGAAIEEAGGRRQEARSTLRRQREGTGEE